MQNEFEFAWEGAVGPGGAWDHLLVVKFEATESISEPFQYDIVLLGKAASAAAETDPHDLVMARASLRFLTNTQPLVRVVHGIVTDAEELSPVPEGQLFRVRLQPPSLRMAHRKRYRIFLDKTLRQILDEVFEGEPLIGKVGGDTVPPPEDGSPAWSPYREAYCYRIADTSRLDDKLVRAFTVQYGESDLAFVTRLLEEEGFTYHYEHGDNLCLLVVSDSDAGRARLAPFLPVGFAIPGREVTATKLGARLRPGAVQFDDFNWKNPPVDMLAEVKDVTNGLKDTLVDAQYPGGYPDASGQGAPLARATLDRHHVEGSFATGEGKLRVLGAGSIFFLDSSKPKYEGEYLVTKLQITAEQAGVVSVFSGNQVIPFACRFELARRGKSGESRFRTGRKTQKPRIVGTQTAFVTAEPSNPAAEIHVGGPPQGEIGCVRLRFHWDRDADRWAKEPTSTWVRVSQMFAGGNEGAVWHPRVGQEVVVDFEEGDPDRPLVVGRVYNGQRLPPAPSVGSPTISTFKSFSTPGGGNYNEFMFDDAAGSERIRMHAAKDWINEVLHDRTETIGHDSSSSVAHDRTEQTGNNRSTTVGVDNSEVVGSNESISIGTNQSLTVGVNQTVMVGSNQSSTIGANQSSAVGAMRSATVGANDSLTVAALQSIEVGGAQTLSVGGAQTNTIGGAQANTIGGSQTTTVGSAETWSAGVAQTFNAPLQTMNGVAQTFNAGATYIVNAGARVTVSTPDAGIHGSSIVTIDSGGSSITVTPGGITIKSGNVTIQDGNISVNGGKVDVTSGSTVKVTGGGNVDVKGAIVKLN